MAISKKRFVLIGEADVEGGLLLFEGVGLRCPRLGSRSYGSVLTMKLQLSWGTWAAKMMHVVTFGTRVDLTRTRSIPNPGGAALAMPARFARGRSASKISEGAFVCHAFTLKLQTSLGPGVPQMMHIVTFWDSR